MNLKLKTITERADADALLELLERGARETREAYAEGASDDDRPLARRYLDAHFGGKQALIVSAESEGGSLGLAATAPMVDPLTGDSEAHLVVLWVDPSVRHRGVARALVAEVRRRLAERGHAILTARASHNDDALISMGERWGLVRAWELMSSD